MDEISLKILNATEKRNRLKQELEEVEVYIFYLKQQRQQQQQGEINCREPYRETKIKVKKWLIDKTNKEEKNEK